MIDGTVETRLAAISPELTAALAEAEKAVGQVEDFLKKCALNVWASVEISRQVSIEDDPEGWKDEVRVECGRVLCYGRVDGEFHIRIREVRFEPNRYGGEDTVFVGDPILWADATNEDRVESFAQLPALLKAIISKAADALKGASEAAVVTAQILEEGAKPEKK